MGHWKPLRTEQSLNIGIAQRGCEGDFVANRANSGGCCRVGFPGAKFTGGWVRGLPNLWSTSKGFLMLHSTFGAFQVFKRFGKSEC